MKRFVWCIIALASFALTACTTTSPSDRIAAHQADFATWPPDIQAKVRAGQADVGFTPEQVLVALGAPDHKSLNITGQQTTEIWIYHRRAARLGIGLGFGSYGRSSAVGGSVSANGIPLGQDMDGQVVFNNGRVTNVMVFTR